MSKKNNKTINRALSFGAAVSAAIVIISMFFDYIKLVILKTTIKSYTGFNIYEGDDTSNKLFITIILIISVAVIALGVLRILGMFDGKLFSLIFAAAGVALIIFSVILFITVVNVEIAGNTEQLFERSIGLILNLIFSILAGLCCVGAFLKSR